VRSSSPTRNSRALFVVFFFRFAKRYACGTFNVLNDEDRNVVAALFPITEEPLSKP
jgi:hypothetical protein